MKVIIRVNQFGISYEDRQKMKNHLVEELNKDGLTVVPSYCDVFVIEGDGKVVLDTDMSEYSDKLWQNAYERGKAERPQGSWLNKQKEGWNCSECGEWSRSTDDFCKGCGADMRGGKT